MEASNERKDERDTDNPLIPLDINMINNKEKIIIYYDTENEFREITLNKDKRFIKEYRMINLLNYCKIMKMKYNL